MGKIHSVSGIKFFISALFLILCSCYLHAGQLPLQVSYTVVDDWGSGYTADVTVVNSSNESIDNWTVSFDLPSKQELSSGWNGIFSTNNQNVTITNKSWNGNLAAGQSATVGFGVTNKGSSPASLLNLSGYSTTAGSQPTEPSPDDPFPLEASYKIEGAWADGFVVVVTISNPTDAQLNRWVAEFDLPDQASAISDLWGGNYTNAFNHVVITNPDCHEETQIPALEPKKIGMIVTTTGALTPAIYNLAAMANATSVEYLEGIPEAPVMNLIGSTDGNYTVSWHPVPTANMYTLEESTSSDFADANVIFAGNATQYVLQGREEGVYYYRVYASNQYGEGPYSDSVSVIVLAGEDELSAPELYIVEYDEAAKLVNVSWSSVPGADHYRLEESKTDDFIFATSVYEGAELSASFSRSSEGTYYYRVFAGNEAQESVPSIVSAIVIPGSSVQNNYKIIGYFPNWAMYRSQPFYPGDINFDMLTHINYAFANIDTSGNIIIFDPWADIQYRDDWQTEKPFYGHFGKLVELKKQHPHIKTLISIGGWTLSSKFSEMAESPVARKNFAKKCVDFCLTYGFDGVDIDWEYPNYAPHNGRPIDTVNFTLLLEECYNALKEQSPELLLTIAAPAGPANYANIELERIHQYLDWINLMCYDYHGPWPGDSLTNHHSGLYPTGVGDNRLNTEEAVKYYISQGVPNDKLVVGTPFYGRSYSGVNGSSDGLFSEWTSHGSGTTEEEGMLFFYDIKRNLLNTYERFWDSSALVPYLYNPEKQEFVTYEDEESLRYKCQKVKEMGLSGVMFWEISLDTRPEWDLLNAINGEFRE